MTRGHKTTAPPPDLGRLGRRVANTAFSVANEAAKLLLVIGADKRLAELAKRTVDFQAALEHYKAYEARTTKR